VADIQQGYVNWLNHCLTFLHLMWILKKVLKCSLSPNNFYTEIFL